MSSGKTVLYMGGGGMSGVFGGGVLQTLQYSNAYNRVEAVHAASVGVFNSAYFLARQVDIGREAYFHELPKGIVQKKGILRGAWQRYKGRPLYPLHPDHYFNALHLDYVAKVITEDRKLDLEKVGSQPIPFYVKVFNQHLHKIQHLNIRSDDPLKLLLAAAALPPYTFEYEIIHHARMIDSCLSEVIGLNYLLSKHSGQKIAIILNRRPSGSISDWMSYHMEAFLGSRMYGKPYHDYPIAREKAFKREVEEAMKHKNVLLILPPANSPARPGTTNVAKLRRTFHMGEQAGRQVLEFMHS